MNLQELIIKTEIQRKTVLGLIQKAETADEVSTAMAVERFLKGFLFDLKQLTKSDISFPSGYICPNCKKEHEKYEDALGCCYLDTKL